jgi:hypothetical protein
VQQKDFFESGPKPFETPGSSKKEVFAPLFSKSGCLLSVANGVLAVLRKFQRISDDGNRCSTPETLWVHNKIGA